MRLRRLNGPKSGAGQMYWNLEPTSARFDGQPVQSADSLRARAGVAMPDQTHGRVLDLWALLPARNERLIAIPATTGGAAQPVSVAVALPAAPALPTDSFGEASDGEVNQSTAVTAPVTAPETATTTAAPEVSSAILIEALNAVEQARGESDTPAGSAPVEVAASPVSAPVFTPPVPRLRPALPAAPTLPESQPEAPSNTAEASASAEPAAEAVTNVEAVAEPAAQPATPKPATPKVAPARKARPAVASPAPRLVVRPKPQLRRLIPGESVAFPVGSQPVTSTPGVQLAVPAGYQVYRAPEGWYFLVRVQ